MKSKAPVIAGAALGLLHLVLVGIPFIQSKGGGETLAYLVVFVDFPLYLVAEVAFQRLLLNSVPFNFIWFVMLGTVMYFAIGYAMGLLIDRRSRKARGKSGSESH